MSGQRVEVIGEEHVLRALKGLGEDLRSVEEPSRELGELGRDTAQGRAPVRTGELAGSIAYEADAHGVTLRTPVRWGPYQEFGTRYVRAKRFMAAGYEAMSGKAEPVYTRWIEAAIKRAEH